MELVRAAVHDAVVPWTGPDVLYLEGYIHVARMVLDLDVMRCTGFRFEKRNL